MSAFAGADLHSKYAVGQIPTGSAEAKHTLGGLSKVKTV